ncbi:HNH endonuclease [Rhizobium rhizophilum]|uniref:HNH domain-containing protein n=1 Tax=Rhizobium rhizophilum TaxID=1850373 RepID=A0ABY2QVJ5_9HYPH|nr:HNH endonuclease [Rhizobium rhizophilum]THV13864.1 hypothetical protein E9677_13265 [Rhizobium rhizophilum]
MTESAIVSDESDLVVRSDVAPGLRYGEYKNTLRRDFFYSCAYCTMSEAEASAIRFTIDHYEPRSARPDLEHEYTNLMYACDACNTFKGPRVVPDEAKVDGIRFFRPDMDRYVDHFRRSGIRITALSKLADFSIDALELNRLGLRRLRDLRQRLVNCEEMVLAGIRALSRFRVDQLPPEIRKSAINAIKQLDLTQEAIATALNEVLREHARSQLLDTEDDPVERKARLNRLKGTEALYPDALWRAAKK